MRSGRSGEVRESRRECTGTDFDSAIGGILTLQTDSGAQHPWGIHLTPETHGWMDAYIQIIMTPARPVTSIFGLSILYTRVPGRWRSPETLVHNCIYNDYLFTKIYVCIKYGLYFRYAKVCMRSQVNCPLLE